MHAYQGVASIAQSARSAEELSWIASGRTSFVCVVAVATDAHRYLLARSITLFLLRRNVTKQRAFKSLFIKILLGKFALGTYLFGDATGAAINSFRMST